MIRRVPNKCQWVKISDYIISKEEARSFFSLLNKHCGDTVSFTSINFQLNITWLFANTKLFTSRVSSVDWENYSAVPVCTFTSVTDRAWMLPLVLFIIKNCQLIISFNKMMIQSEWCSFSNSTWNSWYNLFDISLLALWCLQIDGLMIVTWRHHVLIQQW